MSEPNKPRTETRIEEAMNRHAHGAAGNKPTAAPQEEKRRMQRRIEQLKTTMGECEPNPGKEEYAPNPNPKPDAVPTAGQQGHGTGRLLLVGGSSFLVGATLMWFAVGNPQPDIALPIANRPHVASSTIDTPATEPVSAPAKAIQPTIQPAPTPEQEARAMLERWRLAWASRDVDNYLSFYDPDFAPTGQSHAKWAASRRAKLASQSDISVQIRDIRMEPVDAHHIKVSFLQDYASGSYEEVARAKTLQLQRNTQGWFIVGEQQAVKLR